MQKYFFEFRQLIKIGIPIFGSQLSYALMGATDTIIAGRASANDLAGLAVGTAFSNTIWFFFTGIIFCRNSNCCSTLRRKKISRNW
jgi:Na+-driven multidrug efflux pump